MLSGNLVEQNDVSRKRKSYSSQRTNSSSSLPSEASSSTLYSDCSSSSTVNRQQQVGNYSRSSSQTSLAGSSCHEEQLNDSFHRPDSSANSILLPEYSVSLKYFVLYSTLWVGNKLPPEVGLSPSLGQVYIVNPARWLFSSIKKNFY